VIVALSAHGDRENVLQMLDAGAVEYILKGTPAHEILSAIDRLRPGLRV
jgi:DNA-binding NarL/FixJ family response regulator